MMVHPIFLMPVVLTTPLPVRVLFHLSAQVAPPIVPVLAVLPSPFYKSLVPSRVAPSTHATPSLFPPFSISLFAFVRFSCRVVASFPL